MKTAAILIILLILTIYSCKPNKSPMGGAFSVSCACYRDSVATNYPLGNKYTPYDFSQVNTYYQDSCTTLKNKGGYDSCRIFVITL